MKTSKPIGLLIAGILAIPALTYITSRTVSRVGMYDKEEGAYIAAELTEEELANQVKFQPLYTPTDPEYKTQKNMSMSNVGDIETVWNNYKGDGTTIAIIDTGIDYMHPDFYDNKNDISTCHISSDSRYYYTSGSKVLYDEVNKNRTTFQDDDWDCLLHEWDDEYSEWEAHGTNTSGTAAAAANGVGTIGIAPNATILALKTDMYLTSISKAIDYCVSLGYVDVINMSLGAYAETFTDGYGDTQTGSSSVRTALSSAITRAHNAGIIVIAAAGNEKTDHYSYPACNDYVIGVGALNKNSGTTAAGFSNFNKTTDTENGNHNVDLSAPGYVYAPNEGGTESSPNHSAYTLTQGTSFSSPIVAGAAALYKQKNPNATPDQFESDLYATCVDIGTSGWDKTFGHGRLDIGSLMNIKRDVDGITISSSAETLIAGSASKNKVQLTASVTPATATEKAVTWSSNNNGVATVSSTGLVTAVSAGTATIKAKTVDGGYEATCVITVNSFIPVTGVTLVDTDGNTSGTVTKNRSKQLTGTIIPSTATTQEHEFISQYTDIAIVSDTGLVTGRSAGTTEIYYLVVDENDEWYEATYTLTVEAPAGGTSSFLIDVYDETKLSSTSGTGASLDYLNANTTIGGKTTKVIKSYSASGTVQYGKNGGLTMGAGSSTASFTITLNDGYAVDSVTIVGANYDTSNIKVNNATGTGSLNTKGTKLENCTETLVWENLNGVTSLKFESTTKRATIYTIECEFQTQGSSTVYVSGVDIKAGSEVVSGTNASHIVTMGDTWQLTADVKPDNATDKSVTWATSNSSVATVSSSGLVTPVNEGDATITVTTTDGNYSASVDIAVEQAVSSDSVTINPTASVKVGQTTTISADASGTVAWSYENGTGSISLSNQSNTGVTITGVSAGSATVTATCGTETATCAVTVRDSSSSSGEWTLVTDASSLAAGDVVTFAYPSRGYVSGEMGDKNFLKAVSATFTNNDANFTSEYACEFVLGGSTGAWTFTSEEGTLGATGAKAMAMDDGTMTWAISISGSATTISSTNTSYGKIQFNTNAGSERFLNYTSSQGAIKLYRLEGAIDPNQPKYVSEVEVSLATLALDVNGNGNSKTGELTATVTVKGYVGSVDETVTWSTGNDLVATVSSSGLVTAVGVGSTTITATSNADSTKFASCSVTVTASTRTLQNIEITTNPTKLSYSEGETFDPSGAVVTATYNYAPLSEVITTGLTWTPSGTLTSSDTRATVSYTEGGITKTASVDITVSGGGSSGGTTKTLTITRNSFSTTGAYAWYNWEEDNIGGQAFLYTSEKGSMQFNGSKAGRTIFNTDAIPGTITEVSMTCASGKTARNWSLYCSSSAFATSSTDASGTKIGDTKSIGTGTWTVSGSYSYFMLYENDSSAAYISSITITYVTGSTPTPDPVPVTGISLNKNTLSLEEEQYETLVATINPDNADDKAVIWESDNNSVATVDQTGKVIAVSEGETTIRAKSHENGTIKDECTVTVTKKQGGGGDTPGTGEWTLVTDASTLKAGDKVVIASNAKGVTLGAANGKYYNKVNSIFTATTFEHITSLGEGTTEFTLGGSSSAGWTFAYGSNYMGRNSGDTKEVTTATTWGISIAANGDATISDSSNANNRILYNAGSPRFKTYTSALSDTMLLPQIYKYVVGSASDPTKDASDWAKAFLTSLTCDQGVTAPSTTVWASQATTYNALSSDAKALLTNATYNISGSGTSTVVNPGDGVNEDVAKAVARYDFVINKYGTTNYSNFMSRSQSSNSMNTINSSSGVIVTILATSLLSFSALGFFVSRHRAKIK